MFEINSVSELESLSHKVKWQYFEKLVAFIFSENGFEVEQNVVVVKNKNKRQFDVIAKRMQEMEKTFGIGHKIRCKTARGTMQVLRHGCAAARDARGCGNRSGNAGCVCNESEYVC